jgi:predicted dehydrogenase
MDQQNLGKLLEQHWLHSQHVENERAQFMQVYAAIIAGIIVGYGYLISTPQFATNDPKYYWISIGLFLFLFSLTFLGFFLNLRWVQTFEFHRQKVNSIATLLSPKNSMDLSMSIPSMKLRWFKGAFKTRYFFPLFYFFVLAILSVVGEWGIISFFSNNMQTFFSRNVFIIILSVFDLFPIVLALYLAQGGFKAMKALDTIKSNVVLAGCNGEWSQKHYLPFLLKEANNGRIKLWATDIHADVNLDNHNIFNLWRFAENNGDACYLDMTKIKNPKDVPENIDYVFVVTPDRTHCEVAEIWLSRLNHKGNIIIEKPLDISIEAAMKLKDELGDNHSIYVFDHYLAQLQPILVDLRSISRKNGELESMEIKIIEDLKIPDSKKETLKYGMIFDLFSHVIISSAALAKKKSNSIADTLQTAKIISVKRAKYKGWVYDSETWSYIKYEIGDKMVNSYVGKGVGNKQVKHIIISGQNKKYYTFKFNPKSKPVEQFLTRILDGDKIDSDIAGLITFESALKILRLLHETKESAPVGPDYDIGTDPSRTT